MERKNDSLVDQDKIYCISVTFRSISADISPIKLILIKQQIEITDNIKI